MTDETETEAAGAPAKLDPVARTILAELAARGPGASLKPDDAARAFHRARAKAADPPDAWRRYLRAVKQQAIHLARAGRIDILRHGEPVDPNDFKGLWRMRLAGRDKGPGA